MMPRETRSTKATKPESEIWRPANFKEAIQEAVSEATDKLEKVLCKKMDLLLEKVDYMSHEIIDLKDENLTLRKALDEKVMLSVSSSVSSSADTGTVPSPPSPVLPQAMNYASALSASRGESAPSPVSVSSPVPVSAPAQALATTSSANRGFPVQHLMQQKASNGGDGGWTEVKRRKVKREKAGVVIGASVSTGSFSAVKTGYPVKVFISRLPPSMTGQDLSHMILSKAGVSVQATPLISKMPSLYSSYIISCHSTDLATLLHPSVWPIGLVIKRWYDHKRSKSSSSPTLSSSHEPSSSPQSSSDSSSSDAASSNTAPAEVAAAEAGASSSQQDSGEESKASSSRDPAPESAGTGDMNNAMFSDSTLLALEDTFTSTSMH